MHVYLIIDVSGSMDSKLKETTQGVRSLAKNHPKARFTLVEFGLVAEPGVEVVFKNKKARALRKYKARSFSTTPMWDGIGTGLSLMDHDDKNMFVVITDGFENASQQWDLTHVKPLLRAVTAAGCEMLFLGADPNAVEASKTMGFADNRNVLFCDSGAGADAAFSLSDKMMADYDMDISGEDLTENIKKHTDEDKNIQVLE